MRTAMSPAQFSKAANVAERSIGAREKEALIRASLTPDQIFEHMDDLNEEMGTVPVEGEPLVKEVKMSEAPKKVNARPTPSKVVEEPVARKPRVEAAPKPKSLLDELKEEEDSFDAEKEEEAPVNEEEARAENTRKILKMLSTFENPPTEKTVAKWKAEYGDNGVMLLGLGANEVYVFTYLDRDTLNAVNRMMAKAQAEGGIAGQDFEEKMQEKIVSHCVLWPRPLTPAFFHKSRAGVIPALYQAIMSNSYYLNPTQVASLTVVL